MVELGMTATCSHLSDAGCIRDLMELMGFICPIVLSSFVMASHCEAFDEIRAWTDPVPQIRAHSAFYPHLHMRDVKTAAKRGKILVITLIVSAGLVVLVSTAILRSGKEEKADTIETVDPAELRARVIAAAAAGRRGLVKGREHALSMALSTYASACRVEWKSTMVKYSPSVACSIGEDRVTVVIPDDSASVEVRAICGSKGARAIADADGSSIRSSVFRSRALDEEFNI